MHKLRVSSLPCLCHKSTVQGRHTNIGLASLCCKPAPNPEVEFAPLQWLLELSSCFPQPSLEVGLTAAECSQHAKQLQAGGHPSAPASTCLAVCTRAPALRHRLTATQFLHLHHCFVFWGPCLDSLSRPPYVGPKLWRQCSWPARLVHCKVGSSGLSMSKPGCESVTGFHLPRPCRLWSQQERSKVPCHVLTIVTNSCSSPATENVQGARR